MILAPSWAATACLLLPALVAGGGASESFHCRSFSPNKIDYHDATVATLSGINNESACCDACRAHNAARPAGAAASTNCTIGVWYGCGPRKSTCALKATASQPFNSTCVVALQPLALPPPPPPPAPLRFASIYTSHAVLAAAPARAVVWGFAMGRENVTLDGGEELGSVQATLSDVPSGSVDPYGDPYAYPYIWTATLSAVPASFTPHTLVVRSATSESTIDDVLFGDVWVCGGQSNMEYSINGSNGEVIKHPPVNNSLVEIANMREFPSVRLFRSGHQSTTTPMLEELPPHNGGSMDPVAGWSAPCLTVGPGVEKCRVDFSSMCYFYGRNVYSMLAAKGRQRPIGMIQACWSGSPDEPWMSSSSLDKCMKPPRKPGNGGMLNGMIRPLLNTTITGAIWYQGESDSTHPGGAYDGYNCTFPAMIEGWRELWFMGTGGQTSRTFPFGFVQLNSVNNATVYNDPADPTDGDPFSPAFGYGGLRWAQTAGYGRVPNPAQPGVFMAVSVDTPDRPHPFRSPLNGNYDPGCNVHSPFKQPTAARLARAALAAHYNMSFDTVTPLAGQLSHGPRKGELVLAIENGGSGVSRLRSSEGFEALSAGHWVSCPVTAHTASTVTVSGVPDGAKKLRYNWWSNPCGLEVFGCAVYVDVEPLGHVFSGDFPFLPLPPFVADIPPPGTQ